MDWEAWARKAERALSMLDRGSWQALFAPGARFGDPHTPSTTDLRSISRQTRSLFPDWHQEITRIRGGSDWAVFEWVGRATFTRPGTPGSGTPITMHGATIIEVNADGLVTTWRDYLDRKEPEQQIRAAMSSPAQRR
ncbi:MAG: nuclear transport factor 2 family protein [Myxococcota bacterium]